MSLKFNLRFSFLTVTYIILLLLIALTVTFCKLNSDAAETETTALWIMIFCHIAGSVATSILGGICFVYGDTQEDNDNRKNTFLKLKLLSMYILGACYFLHCFFNLLKYFSNTQNKYLGIANFIIAFFHILIYFVYFAAIHKKEYNQTYEKICLISILFSNIGTLMEALSTDFLFNATQNSTVIDQNKTRPIVAIEKTNPLLPSAVLGFSVLIIDLLFTKVDETPLESDAPTETKKKSIAFKTLIQIIFLPLSFFLLAFTFTELLTSDSSADLECYVISHIVFKLLNIGLMVIISIGIDCKETIIRLRAKLSNIRQYPLIISEVNVWVAIFITACIVKCFHHIFCFGLPAQDVKIEIHVVIDNIISIVLAIIQTVFILVTYSGTNFKHKCELLSEKCITNDYRPFICSLLGMMNMALWFSDSIGKEKLIYGLGNNVVENLRKSSLLFSIFFLFQAGLEFLNFFLCNESNKRRLET